MGRNRRGRLILRRKRRKMRMRTRVKRRRRRSRSGKRVGSTSEVLQECHGLSYCQLEAGWWRPAAAASLPSRRCAVARPRDDDENEGH
eukprot:7208786-Pyramimonas_sp.AAC.1